MAQAIFYTRQTCVACAGMCMCENGDQMEKTAQVLAVKGEGGVGFE